MAMEENPVGGVIANFVFVIKSKAFQIPRIGIELHFLATGDHVKPGRKLRVCAAGGSALEFPLGYFRGPSRTARPQSEGVKWDFLILQSSGGYFVSGLKLAQATLVKE